MSLLSLEDETMNFDAITVAPYMGADSVLPFLEWENKWVILLGLTSNTGSHDFQQQRLASGEALYETVLRTAQTWGSPTQLMFVAGATHQQHFAALRQIAPESFFLVPGVGAQGGSLAEVSAQGMNSGCGLLVNSSREIIYADSSENFAVAAAKKAQEMQQAMAKWLP